MERYLLVVSDADEIAAVNLLEVISARRVAQYNHVTASGVGYGASSFVPQYASVVSFVDPFLREACSGIYLPPTIPPVLCLSSAMFLFMEFRVYNWNWGSKTVSELSFLTSDRLVSAMKVCTKWASAVLLFRSFSPRPLAQACRQTFVLHSIIACTLMYLMCARWRLSP